jgi:hypothetical protein
MVSEALQNINRPEYTISGLKLLPAQINILMQSCDDNTVLKHLNMVRKGISDENAQLIAKSLCSNKGIEHIELSGNNLEAGAAKGLGEMLLKNKTLKTLNLEMNDLISNGKDPSGIRQIAEALRMNTTLISLNLNSTGLDQECSSMLADAMEYNDDLILLDVEGNPDMNIYDVRRIQDKLAENRKVYYYEREREFKERRLMQEELNICKNLDIEKESGKSIKVNQKVTMEKLDEKSKKEYDEFILAWEKKYRKDIEREQNRTKKKGKKKGRKKKRDKNKNK